MKRTKAPIRKRTKFPKARITKSDVNDSDSVEKFSSFEELRQSLLDEDRNPEWVDEFIDHFKNSGGIRTPGYQYKVI